MLGRSLKNDCTVPQFILQVPPQASKSIKELPPEDVTPVAQRRVKRENSANSSLSGSEALVCLFLSYYTVKPV